MSGENCHRGPESLLEFDGEQFERLPRIDDVAYGFGHAGAVEKR